MCRNSVEYWGWIISLKIITIVYINDIRDDDWNGRKKGKNLNSIGLIPNENEIANTIEERE